MQTIFTFFDSIWSKIGTFQHCPELLQVRDPHIQASSLEIQPSSPHTASIPSPPAFQIGLCHSVCLVFSLFICLSLSPAF